MNPAAGAERMDAPIDSRQLQCFVALAKGGGLKAAAAEIGVTESAVSHSLKNLETDLGVRLFERNGKGLSLSSAGRTLFPEAVEILRRMRDIRRFTAAPDSGAPEMRIASDVTYIKRALPAILTEFRQCFPTVRVSVLAADRDEAISLVERDEVDAAILTDHDAETTTLESRALFSDEFYLVMARDHKLARFEQVPLHWLRHETVFLGRDSRLAERLRSQISRTSTRLGRVNQMASSEAVRQMVHLGLGVAFLCPWSDLAAWEDPAFAWRPVSNVEIRREWRLAWHREKIMDLRMKTLLGLCTRSGLRTTEFLAGCRLASAPPVPEAGA